MLTSSKPLLEVEDDELVFMLGTLAIFGTEAVFVAADGAILFQYLKTPNASPIATIKITAFPTAVRRILTFSLMAV